MKYVAALLLLAMALPAAADEVVLRNGSRIEGHVTQSDDEVVVTLDSGTITFRRSEVARVISGKSPLQEWDERLRQLKSDDLEGRFRLALWAKQRGLENRAKSLLEEILLADPDHAGARAELGYRRHEGRWMTEDEIRAVQGYVKFRGAWIKKTEAEEILQREADRAVAAALEGEIVRARKELIEAEASYVRAQAEALRVRTEIERVRREVFFPIIRYATFPTLRSGLWPRGFRSKPTFKHKTR